MDGLLRQLWGFKTVADLYQINLDILDFNDFFLKEKVIHLNILFIIKSIINKILPLTLFEAFVHYQHLVIGLLQARDNR